MEIYCLSVTPIGQNARLLVDPVSRKAVAIDPGGEPERILNEAKKVGAEIEAIWLTHSHLDHCGGVAPIVAKLGVPLFAHPNERDLRARVEEIATLYGFPRGTMVNCPEPDVGLTGGETLSLGSFEFKALFTPGHSPGHLCFYCHCLNSSAENMLIAGDTLFAGSIGRTDLPGGDFETLMTSIREKILTLPPNTRVLSGHGPDTTVGREAVSNPFLKETFVE